MSAREAEGWFFDCYVLVNSRSKELVKNFLQTFVPEYEEMADEYEIPQYSDFPFIVYKTANEIIEFMEKNKEYRYGLYWRSKKEREPKYAMVFYTTDGEMILGLSVDSFDDVAEDFLQKLKEFSDSKFGYYIVESPPFETAEEFRNQLNIYLEKPNIPARWG